MNRKLIFSTLSLVIGFIFAFGLLGLTDFFFYLNKNQHWLDYSTDIPAKDSAKQVPYDLTHIELSYVKNIKPYSMKPDWQDPDDYTGAFLFPECKGHWFKMQPYWGVKFLAMGEIGFLNYILDGLYTMFSMTSMITRAG